MADWTTIADSQVDPKAPVTSELMTALRDNPVAIAEGAANAPRIAEELLVGAGNNSSWTTISGLDTASGVMVHFSGYFTYFSSPPVAQLEISTDGVNFTDTTSFFTGKSASGQYTGVLMFDFDSGSWSSAGSHGGSYTSAIASTGTVAGASNSITHIRFRGPSQSSISVAVIPNGGQRAS